MEEYKKKILNSIYGIETVLKCDKKKYLSTSASNNWDALKSEVLNCSKCDLCKTRQNPVFGLGDNNADLMFIGEGPGENEDKSGEPFVGAAGKLLTKMIEAMGLSREKVYITNVVKCRPPLNREPYDSEVRQCISFLLKQIELVKPKIIVCLGFTATKHLLKIKDTKYTIRGTWQSFQGIKIMPTYHPAYLLYSPTQKKYVWNDLQEVMKELGLKSSI